MIARIFKTAWFAKAARKARIGDDALRMAIRQVERGQADDLGGGVFKKRLDHNRQRAIILTRAGDFWVYTYLFAKQDKANIDDNELAAFRKLAELYRRKTPEDLERELQSGALKEIVDGDQEGIPKRGFRSDT
jgi:hypothetical protein